MFRSKPLPADRSTGAFCLLGEGFSIMEKNKPRPITVLPVVDKNNFVIGIVHLTDLLRQGVV